MSEIYLCLHGLGIPPSKVSDTERVYWLSPERLTEIINLARKYQTSIRSIQVTFDDGNKSDVSVALPILQEHRCKASFFVNSRTVGYPGYLDAADLIRLRDAGMTVGSHGADHVRWTTLCPAELADQVRESIKVLSGIIGSPIGTVAPPFGAYDRRVLKVLRSIGVSKVFTTDDGQARPGAWLKPRFTVTANTSLDEIERRFSGRVQMVRSIRNWVRQRAYQYL